MPSEIGEIKAALSNNTFHVNEVIELKDCNDILSKDVIETAKRGYYIFGSNDTTKCVDPEKATISKFIGESSYDYETTLILYLEYCK